MALFIPWVVFLLWYIAPAVYGQFPTQLGEIIYANIVTILALICAVILEAGFLRIPFSRDMKVVVWGLLLVSVMLLWFYLLTPALGGCVSLNRIGNNILNRRDYVQTF